MERKQYLMHDYLRFGNHCYNTSLYCSINNQISFYLLYNELKPCLYKKSCFFNCHLYWNSRINTNARNVQLNHVKISVISFSFIYCSLDLSQIQKVQYENDRLEHLTL